MQQLCGTRPWALDARQVADSPAPQHGSHSLRRAQRLLNYIEEQGLIVCQLDGAGRRIVTLVELAWASDQAIPMPRSWAQSKAADWPEEDGAWMARAPS